MENSRSSTIQYGENIDNPPQLPFSEDLKDDRLINAVNNAVQTQTMTPLIKEELRCTILSRRHAEGKGEIEYNDTKKLSPRKVFTQQEKERKLRRQEQNRRAAQRCRQKKKERETIVLQEYHEQKERLKELTENLKYLQKEKSVLENVLKSHARVCKLNKSIEYNRHPINISPEETSSKIDIPGKENDLTHIDYSPRVDNTVNDSMKHRNQEFDFLNTVLLDDSQQVYRAATPLPTEMETSCVCRRKVSESSFCSETEIEFAVGGDVITTMDHDDDDVTDVGQTVYKYPVTYTSHVDYQKCGDLGQYNYCGQTRAEPGTFELDSTGLKFEHSYANNYSENDITPLMQFFMESDMDIRRNGEERGPSCSSVDDIDIASILQNNESFAATLVDDQDQSVFM